MLDIREEEMKNKIKNINKGDTDVKRKSSATMLRTPNIIDVSELEMVRGSRGDWDSFQLIGSSNMDERKCRAADETPELEEILDRAKNLSIGRKISALKLELVA